MSKGSSGKMLYFVLYIVLITELLIVITERDELAENEKLIQEKLIGSIANSYKADVSLSASPKMLDYNIGADDKHNAIVSLELHGLVSEAEKDGVTYTVKVAPGSKAPEGFPSNGLSSADGNGNKNFRILKTDGNAKFQAAFISEGDYKFVAQASTKRVLPDYLTESLLNLLKEKIGESGSKEVTSNKEPFEISAKRQGGVKKAGAQLVL